MAMASSWYPAVTRRPRFPQLSWYLSELHVAQVGEERQAWIPGVGAPPYRRWLPGVPGWGQP